MTLHTIAFGETGERMVFLHGLFGHGRNWSTIGRAFEADHRVLLVDLPHHGRSQWSERWDFRDVVEQVAGLWSADDPVTLVGHSLGGKVAMLLALLHPDRVKRLCVVDVSPVTYGRAREFSRYTSAMKALDLDALERREDADRGLEDAVPDPGVRAFLLQNLRREGDAWRWGPNLEVLERDLGVLGGWPDDALDGVAPYDGPVLWLAGGRSDYVTDEYAEPMARWFPRARRVTVKGAGHWVHAEQPAIVTEALRRFLAG